MKDHLLIKALVHSAATIRSPLLIKKINGAHFIAQDKYTVAFHLNKVRTILSEYINGHFKFTATKIDLQLSSANTQPP